MNKQSEKLAKAIAYEAKKKKERDEDKRPAFHVTPTTGWCNDPNGFSRFGEEYHLFYQYYPYENKWGPMHWGHCRTKDFIKWEELPCALASDMEYDGQGCFSGTAVEHEGKHILMYTSVLEKDLDAYGPAPRGARSRDRLSGQPVRHDARAHGAGDPADSARSGHPDRVFRVARQADRGAAAEAARRVRSGNDQGVV